MTTASAADIGTRTEAICNKLIGLEGPLLPILHAVQAEFGYIPTEALPVIAEAVNISRAEIHGVVTFYHDFRDHPAGRHMLKICRAEACQSMGGEAVAERLLSLLGVDWGGTTNDGAVTVEPVYCLGLCACSPSAMLDGKVFGRLNAKRAEALAAEARA